MLGRSAQGCLVACLLGLVLVGTSAAQSGGASGYCEGDGGAAGAATDAEHSVLIGEPPLPAGVRESRITVDGVGTRLLVAGPAGAEDAVVFVHGHPGSARDWDDLLAASGAFTRAVALDVSGYGKSDEVARQVQTTDGVAGFIEGVRRQLGIERVVLVVHDFGGPWAMTWAARHADILEGVVLINSGVFIDYTPHTAALVWATPEAGEAQMASTTRQLFRDAIQTGQERPLPAAFVDRMYDDYDRHTRCAALRYYRSAIYPGFSDPQYMSRPQVAALSRRRRPALVIWGERDPYIPPEQAYKQRQPFPDARVEIFPDSAHFPFVDNAERTRNLVVPFLRPSLALKRVRGRVGRRRIRVRVETSGMLPVHQATIGRGRARSRPRMVSGQATLVLRLRRKLRPRPYQLELRALGLAPKRFAFRPRRPRR